MGYEWFPLIDPSFEVGNVVDVPSPQSMVTAHGASWSGSLHDGPSSVNSAPTNTVCSPPAVTLVDWFGGLGDPGFVTCSVAPGLSGTVRVAVSVPPVED